MTASSENSASSRRRASGDEGGTFVALRRAAAGVGPAARFAAAAIVLALAIVGAWSAASREARAKAHSRESDCSLCHEAARGAIENDPTRARASVRADLERVCLGCHGQRDASHPTHVAARARGRTDLPLGADGRVECYTCHFMHAEDDRNGKFVRIDNRRGGLCLSCHTMAELEKG